MKYNRHNKIICLLLSCLFVLSFNIISFAKYDKTNNKTFSYENITNISDKLIGVSKYGDKLNYPENSLEGIQSASKLGADMILISVKKTADGKIVVFKDDNLSRMCVLDNGKSVKKNINEITYEELSEYKLRSSTGNLHENVTGYSVPTLENVIDAVGNDVMLIVEGGWQFKDDIYSLIVQKSAVNSVMIMPEKNAKDISSWSENKNPAPLIFSNYKGTVVWKTRGYINKQITSASAVLLSSSNAYSLTFSKDVITDYNSKIRFAVDMTDTQLSGKRSDTELYWDDITSRGFSIIITDNIEQFNRYKKRTNTARENLNSLIEKIGQTDLSLCSTTSVNGLNKELKKAREVVSSSYSAMELEAAYNSLNIAVEALSDKTSKDKGNLTVSTGRVIAAIIITIGFVFFEVLIYRYRDKMISLRQNGNLKKKRFKKAEKKD